MALSGSTNQVLANCTIEEAIRQGISHFCIAPGSRSTPLALAIASHPKAQSHIHFDERGLAFYALGLAKGSQQTVAIITTSGSAVGNLLPAIIEASLDHIPLLILTADRPISLRDCCQNQTIDQVKIFGSYVRYYCELPHPSENLDLASALKKIGYATFSTQFPLPGPVHINCPFSEPFFEPSFETITDSIQNWYENTSPFSNYYIPNLEIDPSYISPILEDFQKDSRGIIVAGSHLSQEECKLISLLSEHLGFPIIADIQSPLRLIQQTHLNITFSELLLKTNTLPSFSHIIQFGQRFTSKPLLQLIQKTPLNRYLVVSPYPNLCDPSHRVTDRFVSSSSSFIRTILKQSFKPDNSYCDRWIKLQNSLTLKLHRYFQSSKLMELTIPYELSQHFSENDLLFVGSSMPIRDLQLVAVAGSFSPWVFANRGASGIDGNLATAFGISEALGRPLTIVIGDLTLLHDLNSLTFASNLSIPPIICVINNQGGGIFSFLEIAKRSPHFEAFFSTPHNFSLESLAKGFKFKYASPKTKSELKSYFLKPRTSPLFLEITSDKQQNVIDHQELISYLC